MVSIHEAGRVDPPGVAPLYARQAHHERLPIDVVPEDRPIIHAMRRQVVDGSRLEEALRTRHGITLPRRNLKR